MADLLVEVADAVATVTLNRPEKRNALTTEGCRELAGTLRQVAEKARAIVLTGAGPSFSAGGDLGELTKFAEGDAEQIGDGLLYQGFQLMIRTVRELDVPVVAAINGPAVGAGLDLALACDIRICSATARLSHAWVRLGLVPGTGGAFWTTMLAGWARASQMILTGEPIDGEKAYEWGLVNEAVAPWQVLPRAQEVAAAIGLLSPGAVAANKRALDAVLAPGWEAALAHARELQTERFASGDVLAALRSLKEEL